MRLKPFGGNTINLQGHAVLLACLVKLSQQDAPGGTLYTDYNAVSGLGQRVTQHPIAWEEVNRPTTNG